MNLALEATIYCPLKTNENQIKQTINRRFDTKR